MCLALACERLNFKQTKLFKYVFNVSIVGVNSGDAARLRVCIRVSVAA